MRVSSEHDSGDRGIVQAKRAVVPVAPAAWYRVGDLAMKRALPILGIVLLFVVAAVVFVQRSHHEMYDFEVYRVAGVRAAAGETLYRESDGHWQFKYLPAFALVIAPLAQLPPVGARAVWYFLTLVLVIVLVNRSLALLPGRRRTAAFLVWLIILFMGKYYAREIGLGQGNALMAVLVLAAVASVAPAAVTSWPGRCSRPPPSSSPTPFCSCPTWWCAAGGAASRASSV